MPTVSAPDPGAGYSYPARTSFAILFLIILILLLFPGIFRFGY